jgi:hypothetical protein
MSEKIHITIEDGIEPAVALDHVRSVVKHGRISKYNTLYCYLTLFPDGTMVQTNDYRKSDCFVVCKDRRRNKE